MEMHGFELLQEQEIAELNTRVRLFRHVRTGAQLLSLENEDANKVFGINFRTPPPDSTGLPHIMEHSVLCGSRKYPVKEPFVELMKGSLNTFLNAFTYPDKTCYPVASQNLQDFYNLIDVYLDAVLHPLIPEHTLEQEGWHYEMESADAPLAFKGVVFNEMKGVYSSPDSLLSERTQQSLYPDSVYALDYGGNPEAIPDLTYSQFKSFHETYYHPSNAYIYFYGDDDPDQRLKIIDQAFAEFDARPVESEILPQPQFEEPRSFTFPYDAGKEMDGQKSLMTVSWLLPDPLDPQRSLSLSILSHILVATPASPLRKALIDSGLGEDLTGGGLEPALRQMHFSTGLKGIAPGSAQKVEDLIMDTLRSLAEQGFDPDTVAASLNTVEFRLRENNTGSFPRGLGLMLRALSTWLYGGDPLSPLAFEAPLLAIKAALQDDPRYFEKLLQEYFLENPHRVSVALEPDPEVGTRREAAEQKRLQDARTQLDDARLAALVERTRELKELQEAPDTPEALASIPLLARQDLDRQARQIPVEQTSQAGVPLLYHDIFTNGILYLDAGFDLHALPQEWLPYVPLFAAGLLEMGTQSEDFVRLTQRIGRSTGGISTTWYLSPAKGRGAAWLFLRGKAVTSQAGALLDILRDIVTTVRWDNPERFRQLVLEARSSLETSLTPSGHQVINRRLRARFNPYDWAFEQMSGVENLFALRQLEKQIEQDWAGVVGILQGIQSRLLVRENMILNATLDQDGWAQVRPQLDSLVGALPEAEPERNTWQPDPIPDYEGLSMPAQVNFVGKGAELYSMGYQLHGSVLAIVPYLRNTYLWEKVRVQGGAYGGFCVFDRLSGVFSFLSYRDPNLTGTLQVYDQASQFLQRLDLHESELTKSIIGAIGDLDQPLLPDAQGYTSLIWHLSGISDEERQQLRDEVLATSPADFKAFGEVLQKVCEAGVVSVLGSADALQAARDSGAAPLEIKKVL
jgi:presequence protease